MKQLRVLHIKWTLVFALLVPFLMYSQDKPQAGNEGRGGKGETTYQSIRPKKKKDTVNFTSKDYKMITYARDTTMVDTTLTIYKYYKQNVAQKDMFGAMSFANVAQVYNPLTYDFSTTDFMPSMGAEAKKTLYLKPEEVKYYLLPTPMTEFNYQSAIEQGQSLNSLFAINLKPNLNVFIAYKGLRSLGNYQRMLVSNGNFRMGFSYVSPNKKYTAFAHYATHDVTSQENGGLSNVEQFESGGAEFKNRAVIDVNLSDAENKRDSKRYFLQHEYEFLRNRDSLASYKQIRFRHRFLYETEYYYFMEDAENSYFGDAYVSTGLRDDVRLKKMINQIGAELELPYLGKTYVYGSAYFYNYFFNNAYYVSGVLQPHQIKNTDYTLGAQWKKKIGKFSIDAQGEQTMIGKITGTRLNGKLSYIFNDKNQVTAGIDLHSSMPNFNYLLYQSDYTNYNWYHYDDFGKENTQTIYGDFKTQWINLSASVSNINNYTYFKVQETSDGTRGQSLPTQYSGDVQYFKLQLQRDFTLGKWGMENRVLLQRVVQNELVVNVPDVVTRNSIYFSTHLFKKAMYLQTGVGFTYFTTYYSNRYNPLLAEFEVQTSEKTGSFPMFDYFLNAKVRTMRIFLSLQHFNASFTGYDYYAAPTQPYRDFSIRLGIVWNIFS